MKRLIFILILFCSSIAFGQYTRPVGTNIHTLPTYAFFYNSNDSTVGIFKGNTYLNNYLWSKQDTCKLKSLATLYRLSKYVALKDTTVNLKGYTSFYKGSLMKLKSDTTTNTGYATRFYAANTYRALSDTTGNKGTATHYQVTGLARSAISLTTTGTSGAATYNAGVLNIPQYTGGSGSMTYPTGSGIAIVASGTSWGTTITDNSTNWNTAYGWGNWASNFGSGAGKITQGNDSRLSDSRPASDVYAWAKASTKPTYTYSEVGAQVAGSYESALGNPSVNGYVLSSTTTGTRSWVAQGSSMVYPSAGIAVSTGSAWTTPITDNSANWNTAYNNRISTFTTTGSSGSATFSSNTLNIPTYTLAGLGGIGLASLSSTATGLTYTNSTGVFSLTSGYAIPTTTNISTWNGLTTFPGFGTTHVLSAYGDHVHGNITNAGAIGTTTGLPIITTTSGVLTTGSFGTTTGTFSAGDHNHSGTYEPVLGNPGTNGYVLSSTTAGTRSWVAQGGSMTYPTVGIAVSTGSAWGSSLTDNSTNWNTAYSNRIATFTTTGSSGAATWSSNTLNIPTYTLAGLGGIGLTAISSTATGLTYTNTTGVFSLTSGYAIPTSANITTWNGLVTFPGFGTTHVLAAYGDHTHAGVYEPVLGNPASNGQILSSTTAGTRSWISPTSYNGTVQALSGTSVAWSCTSGVNARLTLTGNTTITLSNATAGMNGNIKITNPATAYTITWALSGATVIISPAVWTSTGVVTCSGSSLNDVFSWYYDGTNLIINGNKGYK